MKCPNCGHHLSLLQTKTKFQCPSCGTQLVLKGDFAGHIAASIVFIILVALCYGVGISGVYLWITVLASAAIAYFAIHPLFIRAEVQDGEDEETAQK